jgi:hypothetical protein
MNQSTIERLAAEWETIQHTKFWEAFVEKIQEKRALESRFCEVNTEVVRNQGAIQVLDYILGRGETQLPLAERILEELRQKSKEVKS